MPSAAEIISFAEFLIGKWGIIIVPVGAFLENSVILGFIFPGVTLIFLSGFVARTTGNSLWLIVLLAALGAFLGDNLDYFLGRKSGKILENKPLFAKYVRAVEPFLAKHGVWAIFAGRFSGYSRAWVALASGVVKFSYWKFALASCVSAFIWTSAWILGGYLLGGNRQLLEEWFSRASIIVWLGFVVVAAYYFRTRIKLVYDLVIIFVGKSKDRVKNGLFKKSVEP